MSKIILSLIILAFLPLSAFAENQISASGYIQLRQNDSVFETESAVGVSSMVNDFVDFRFIGSLITNEIDNKPRANILLVDLHNASQNLGVRIGRHQHNLGFYTTQLNWAPARDMHMAPQGIYRENFRYLLRSGDGVQGYSKIRIGDAIIDLEANYTHKPVLFQKDDLAGVYSQNGGRLSEDGKSIGYSAQIDIRKTGTTLRYDQQRLFFDLEGTNFNATDGSMRTIGHYFGIKQELDQYSEIIFEYLIIKKQGSSLENTDRMARSVGYNKTFDDAKGFGISIAHQISDNWKVVFGRSTFYFIDGDKYGKELSSKTGIDPTSLYMEDSFISFKYRRDKVISTLEYHKMHGTATFSPENKNGSDRNDKVIFTVTRMF